MLENIESPWKYLVAALIFPMYFQGEMWKFAWGVGDPFALAMAKRVLLLLPVLSFLFSCWATVACGLSIIVRSQRRDFMSVLFLTWWDVGRSIFFFWGGFFKFAFVLLGWIYGFVRLLVFGILIILKDILLFPLRAFGEVSQTSFRPGIPWPAMAMMVTWTAIEALIFTFVMHPLVVDILDSFADGEFAGGIWLRILLFIVFSFFVLGSYAVIHTFGLAIKNKKIGSAIAYGIIEVTVAAVESVLFYREFVDALVPWFAQYAGKDFELGMGATLFMAFAIWFSIRCMTWFLFGASAIPMLLAMIQRTGVDTKEGGRWGLGQSQKKDSQMLVFIDSSLDHFRKEMDWVHTKAEEVLSAFLVPPSQILASCINFCTLFLSGNHLFSLPFRSYKDILDTRDLIEKNRKSMQRD